MDISQIKMAVCLGCPVMEVTPKMPAVIIALSKLLIL